MRLDIKQLPQVLQERLGTPLQVVTLFGAVTNQSRVCFDQEYQNLGISDIDPSRARLDPFTGCRNFGPVKYLTFCRQGDTVFVLNDSSFRPDCVLTLFPSSVMIVDVKIEGECIIKSAMDAFEEGCVYNYTHENGYVQDEKKQ
jgi:hypothetical protein